MNRPLTDWPEFETRTELVNPSLDWLESLDEESFRRLFRRSSMERAKPAGLRRNFENARKNQA
jgi:epoxyqueuosine reductase QueG